MPSVPVAHVPGVPYSSHNLSHTVRFTTAPGVLKPVLIDELVPGARYRLDIGMLCDTFPTQNPLYGTFEIHTDVFICPLKNWYASFHTDFPQPDLLPDQIKFHYINMSGSDLPTVDSNTFAVGPSDTGSIYYGQAHVRLVFSQMWPVLPDSLLDYLGFPVGIHPYNLAGSNSFPEIGNGQALLPFTNYMKKYPDKIRYFSSTSYNRDFCGHGFLAYYDVVRSYYLNPQEENFYIFGPNNVDLWFKENDAATVPWPSGQVTWGELGTYTFKLGVLDRSYLNSLYYTGRSLNQPGDALIEDENEKLYPFMALRPVPINSLNTWLNKVFTSYSPDGSTETAIDLPYTFAESIFGDASLKSFGLPGFGFVVRCFRPDRLTSWMNSDYVLNVKNASRIQSNTAQGVTFEQIIASEKFYNFAQHSMLSNGRYKDWNRAVYRVDPNMDSDIPILMSHSRTRMEFNGIYQNSGTQTFTDPQLQRNALGGSVSIGSCQSVDNAIVFDCTQPSVLLVMNSIVPIADYPEGIDPMLLHNKFTDCYAPDFDGLGWQPLSRGELSAIPFPARVYPNGSSNTAFRTDPFSDAVGFQPSWEEYRSRVNRIHGDFHDTMSNFVLRRTFPYSNEVLQNADDTHDDLHVYTSYIIPTLYTDAWAVSNIAPFRVQYAFGYRARLPMSKYNLPKLA